MKRRTFIKSLVVFTGLFTFSTKFELTRAFPFVRRKPTVPQMVSTVTTRGVRTITLPVSHAQKDDILIATIATHSPNEARAAIASQGDWTMHNGNMVYQSRSRP